MNEPVISRDFTVEDIHKIREYNYEITKNMPTEELRKFYRKNADEGERRIEEFRNQAWRMN
jgi:hypothetical protein